ncbi:hypothetical protein [Umezawaea sp. Da 62-37]|uniref:hypothetical protein n=1 Tax=Umezawaea sp. Da 62-37 TaxID=3075927 RepID=UPI0028F707C5|nr:hypothetical protein [Umezawaea sp. Da 62-37]WNV82468.1 hypothetical protein RM788_30205 [Umezawaea sp. Da 62-37]
MSDPITVELPTPAPMPKREPLVARMWRGISGAFAVGMVMLAIALVVVQLYARGRDLPGPGWDVVMGHWGAAVVAIVGQVLADRRRGWLSALLSLAVLVVGFGVLWIYWWA